MAAEEIAATAAENNKSLFASGYARQEEKTRNDFRKHMLKTYLSKLNDNDEMVRLVKTVIDVKGVDVMSDTEIREAVNTITVAQNILDDGDSYERIFELGGMVIRRLRLIMNRKYPRYYDVTDTITHHFESTFQRLHKVKNRHVDKLVLISSMNLDGMHRGCGGGGIPSLGSILFKCLITAVGYGMVFGALEWIHGTEEEEEDDDAGPVKRLKKSDSSPIDSDDEEDDSQSVGPIFPS